MADNLPVLKANQDLALDKPASNSLLGRGLAAIQQKQIAIADQDERYRQARDVYDQITDYGRERRFDPDLLPKQGRQLDIFEAFETSEIQPWIDKTNQLAQVFRELKRLADEGYGKAFFPLALMYQGRQGVMQDAGNAKYYGKLAFNWCFENKGLDDPELWTDLGWMYDHEIGVELDKETDLFYHLLFPEDEDELDEDTNLFYYLLCPELDYSHAPFAIREWYATNWEKEDDEYRCFNYSMLWYRKAADQGYARAQYNVGEEYLANPFSEQDVEVAALWFGEAAGQGCAGAQCSLGRMYNSEYGMKQSNESIFWHLDNEHLEQAVFWYRKAAEQGFADAQFDLGEIYEDPLGGIDVDSEQSVFWYQKAAAQGHAKAQCRLGSLNEDERGTEEDLRQAFFWYRKAAEQGSSSIQDYLACLYASSLRVEEHPNPELMEHFGITDIQAEAIMEKKRHYLDILDDMGKIYVDQPDDWFLLVSDLGYGVRFQLIEILNKTLADKLLILWSIDANILKLLPIANESDFIAIATRGGRLLIFPVAEVITSSNKKAIRLILNSATNLHDSVVAVEVLPVKACLKIISGKRHVSLRGQDIGQYTDNIGKKGKNIPRGFQNVTRLEYEYSNDF